MLGGVSNTRRRRDSCAGTTRGSFALVVWFVASCAHPIPRAPVASPSEPDAPRGAHAPVPAAEPDEESESEPPPIEVPSDAIRVSLERPRTLEFELHPQDGILVACDPTSCLAVWVERGAVRSASLDPAASASRVSVAASGSQLVRVAGLVPHPRGFAFLRYVSRTFEIAELELCVVARDGAFIRSVPLGAMHGNSSEPALFVEGELGLVGLPATDTRVEFIDLASDLPGARHRAPGAHTTTPGVEHDGNAFVTTWLTWNRGDVSMRLRRHRDEATDLTLPYFSQAGFACGDGACVLAGERDHAVLAIAIGRVPAEPRSIGTDRFSTATVHRHGAGLLVVARGEGGARVTIVGATSQVSDVTGTIPGLTWRGDERYLGVEVTDPPDFEPMSYPCPSDESSTCMDVPAYQRLRVHDVTVAVPRP